MNNRIPCNEAPMMKTAFRTVLSLLLPLALLSCSPKLKEADVLPATGDDYWAGLRLWYMQPAENWNEALPVGNGRLGAMVFGRVEEERIQLNEDTLWDGYPVDRNNPGALEALPVVRRLIFEGKNEEATKLAGEKMMGIPPRIKSYQTLGDLIIGMEHGGEPSDYTRELSMDTGIAATRYVIGGTVYAREVFSSAPDRVIVVRLECSEQEGITCDITMRRDTDPDAGVTDPPEITATNPGTITLFGRCGDKGMSFAAKAVITAESGNVSCNGGTVRVENAGAVTILLAAATSYIDNRHYDADPGARCDEHLSGTAGKSYAAIKNAHIADHRRLFRRAALDLGGADGDTIPTDERLKAVKDGGTDSHLVGLYFQYGRYLLMGSSRPGTMPANLQGIWNEHLKAPWNSDFHTNINLQMNYYPAEVANLAECHEPLFDLMESLVEPGGETARRHYGCRGWVVHHLTDVWGFATPADGVWGVWPMGAAWLAHHPWEHYLFTGDVDFLERRGYPLMKGAARFILDFLVEAPPGTPVAGRLVTNPSHSPENRFMKPDGTVSQFTYAATMDIEIINDLFDNCLDAIAVLAETKGGDFDAAFRDEIAAAQARLAPIRISPATGRIQEWVEDYGEPEPGHRHMSHLYALYPDDRFTPGVSPEFADAARKTIDYRLEHGGGHTGWSRAWIVNFRARLLEKEKAFENVNALLAKSTLPNLFDDHPPFQIDGNFGGAAGIAEMLVQSHGGKIVMLPALPGAWGTGYIKGLCARGGFEADIAWENGVFAGAVVRSKTGGPLRIACGIPARGKDGKTATLRPGTLVLDTKPGETYVIAPDFTIPGRDYKTQ